MKVFEAQHDTTVCQTFSRRTTLGLFLLSLTFACEEGSPRVAKEGKANSPTPKPSVVSLSPGITETVLRLGAGGQLVAVSDYCNLPSGMNLPRVGSALTPDYEAIARTRPQLIVATEVAGSQLEPLSKLANTVSLPWLELDQVTGSLKRLGELLGRPRKGVSLAATMKKRLSALPGGDAPRILWVLDLGDGSSNTTWFIRNNSLHGAVLRAAGARNAVSRHVVGPPKLSPEELLEINPDGIIMVSSQTRPSPSDLDGAQQRMRKHFMRWTPLVAVKTERLLAIDHPNAMSLGPSVLDLVPVLEQAIDQLMRDDARNNNSAKGATRPAEDTP